MLAASALAILAVTAVSRTALAGEVTCFGPRTATGAFTTANHIVFADAGIALLPNGGMVTVDGTDGKAMVRYGRIDAAVGLHAWFTTYTDALARSFPLLPLSAKAGDAGIVVLMSEPHLVTFLDAAKLVVPPPLFGSMADAGVPDRVKASFLSSEASVAVPLDVAADAGGGLAIALPQALPVCSAIVLEHR